MAMLNNQRVKYPSIYTNVFNSKDVLPVFHSNAALKNPCFDVPLFGWIFPHAVSNPWGYPIDHPFFAGIFHYEAAGDHLWLGPSVHLSPPQLGFAAHLPVEVFVPTARQADAPGPAAAELEGETADPTADCHFCQRFFVSTWRSMKHDHLSISSIIIINHGQLNKRLL